MRIFEGIGRRLADALSVWLTLEELRRSEEGGRQTPVIVVTAKDLTKEDLSRLNKQVHNILEKSTFKGEEILDQINMLLEVNTSS